MSSPAVSSDVEDADRSPGRPRQDGSLNKVGVRLGPPAAVDVSPIADIDRSEQARHGGVGGHGSGEDRYASERHIPAGHRT